MPAPHVIVEHTALAVQQSADVVPTTPYFAGSLKVLAAQTPAARHLVPSFTQQLPSSEVAQTAPAQKRVA
jgi:hypothetical protein